jgi:hypothetical protein
MWWKTHFQGRRRHRGFNVCYFHSIIQLSGRNRDIMEEISECMQDHSKIRRGLN